ncbi:MAG: hypothetical protein ACRYGP_05425 [Janthinobacterium lividum]
MVTVAAISISFFLVAVLVFLVFDHSDELRARFGSANKALLPPLNFSQWTIVALIIAISALVAVILVLGVVNAGHRLTCNALTLSGELGW